MKKNGKKYRRLQKEKELRKNLVAIGNFNICQEVDGINIGALAISHIIIKNPIMYECEELKRDYINKLNILIKTGGWNRRKYESAELKAYENIIFGVRGNAEGHDISYYKYFLLFDIFHILGYEVKNEDAEKLESVKERYLIEFEDSAVDKKIVNDIVKTFVRGEIRKLKQLADNSLLSHEKEYIFLIKKNMAFRKKAPSSVMVTATMSAGKSTFINALAGKYICLSQNMACTSKIHCIVNKAFEDNFAYEYDHDLILTAGKEELLNDNELNKSDKIVVGTKFIGGLSKERIIVNDSPGVNFSGDQEHKIITEKLIKRKNYNLLIYIMNATQLGTNDEDSHLDYVKNTIGRKPVLFIINKIDTFNVEEEDIGAAIGRQTELLKKKGFKAPMVCPVSSRAAYLAKQFLISKLSRTEERELYNFVDKFDQMNLPEYYTSAFKKISVADCGSEEEQLLKTSGIAYVEKIVKVRETGGKINGTGLC